MAADTLQLATEVKAGQPAPPDLVVWPENAAGLDPREYPEHLRPDPGRGRCRRPPHPGRRGAGQPGAQRRPAVGARHRPDVPAVRQAPAGPVRRVHPVPRLHLHLQLAALRCSRWTSRPAIRPSSSARRGHQARRRDLLRGGLRQPGAVGGQRRGEPARPAVQRRRLRDRRAAGRDRAADGDGPDPGHRERPRGGLRLDHRGELDHRARWRADRPAAASGARPSWTRGSRWSATGRSRTGSGPGRSTFSCWLTVLALGLAVTLRCRPLRRSERDRSST